MNISAFCRVVVALLTSAIWFNDAAQSAEPKVVVTIKPIHALVVGIMEGVGAPHLVVDGTSSPHTFTLRPSGAKAISEADVFIRVSEQLEPFTAKIVRALPTHVKVMSLIDTPGVQVLPQRTSETFEGQHSHVTSHSDNKGTADSHIWLDTENAKAIVAEVARALGQSYPESAAKFESNARVVRAKVDALSAEIEARLAPVKGKPFIVFHDALQYFERRFTLPAAGSVTVSPDVQPSAKRISAVHKKIATLGAVCVFAEPSLQPKLVSAVIEGSLAKSGTLDPEGTALSAAGAEHYFQLMRNLASNLRSCLS